MTKLSVDQALIKASSYAKKNEIIEAQKLYQAVLLVFPKNIRAQKGLAALPIYKENNTKQNPPKKTVDLLLSLYNQGQFSVLIKQAQTLAAQYPQSFVVWNMLGVAHIGLGQVRQASEAFEKVTELNPNYADGFNNLGVTLKEQGKLDKAIDAYHKATTIKPDYVDAYFNMAVTFKNLGKLEKAITAYNTVISLSPDIAEAYYNIGIIQQEQGKYDDAINSYNNFISLNPNYADGFNNLGVTLKDQGKLDEALEAYNKAVSLKPDYFEAYNNIGNALKDQGKYDVSLEAFNKALSLNPNNADAYNNMGVTLFEQGKADEAIETYNKALSLKPNYVEAYNNMGNALKVQGKLDEAIEAYNKALSIKPDYQEARVLKLHQQAHICDWNSIEEDRQLFPLLGTSVKSVNPFPLLSLEDAPERHYLRSKAYAKDKFPQNPIPLPAKPIKRPARIRIGYFSSDFKKHPVAYLIAKVIELHNRDKFEIFAYSLMDSKEDELQKRLMKSFDVFRNAHEISDKDVALLAREDKIDIAIDLNGYTQNSRSRIFAYRAAPIQINYLGFPGTMGTEFIDYIIADKHLIAPHNKKYFTEKQIYLPNTYMPTDNGRKFSSRCLSRSEMGLPDDAFVFCCFNNNYKITNLEFDIWMRLLNKVKGSILWLSRSNQLSDKNIIKTAQKRNIDASRIVFADKLPMDEHLSRHKLADLFIDTFAFNAHTTTTEALWAGLPVVTKKGQGFAARVAASLLNAIGLPELVTENEADYEALIIELATNPNKLRAVKGKIAANRLLKPLFDTELYTKHLESGYLSAYQNYFNGKAPQTFYVYE